MIKDKLTQAIAEAAAGVMKNETWPDAQSTSIYADKPGKTPITDAEAGSEHKMTDEATTQFKVGQTVYTKHDEPLKILDIYYPKKGDSEKDPVGIVLNVEDEVGSEMHVRADEVKLKTDEFRSESVEISEAEITEALKKSQPPAEWIHDFVHSKDAKFKGKSKAERINMALGAYYAAQRNESVKEGVEEPRAQGEKNFKAAHAIDKKHDVNQDDQTGTEAMDQSAKPSLPKGTVPTKAENVDGEAINDEDVKKIKASATSAKVPEASGSKQPGAESAETPKDTTKGGKLSAEAPKASGSKQSGAESAEKVANTAPEGKLAAAEPKPKQKGSEPMPKGLKESALAVLLGEEAMSSFDKQYANDNEKALKQLISGQGTEGIDGKLLPQLNKFITAYGDELKKHFGLPIVDGEKKEDDKSKKNEAVESSKDEA